MRILYLSSAILPSNFAHAIHVVKMTNAFAQLGHKVLLSHYYKNEETNEKSRIYDYYGVEKSFELCGRIPKSAIKNLFFDKKILAKIVDDFNPDLIYGRHLYDIYLIRNLGYKFIFETHDVVFNSNIYTNKKILKKYLHKSIVSSKNIVSCILITQAQKQLIEKSWKYKTKIIVAPDAADEQPDFEPLEEFQAYQRLKIGYFGHLYAGRGIEIIYELSKLLPDYIFLIFGGNAEDIEKWKNKTKEQKNIIFYGFVEPAKVYKYRNSCDILLAPYQKEVKIASGNDTSAYMSPLKIFEYMSSKKPIICSDLPVLREVLNENNAILVKSDDITAWQNAIKKLKDSSLRMTIAENAYNDFINNYTWLKRANYILEQSLK